MIKVDNNKKISKKENSLIPLLHKHSLTKEVFIKKARNKRPEIIFQEIASPSEMISFALKNTEVILTIFKGNINLHLSIPLRN